MRTITEVVDWENEDVIRAEDFFAKNIGAIFEQRYELERAIQRGQKLWVCPFCRQPIKIRGKRDGEISLHFYHVSDRLDCPYKSWKKYTKEQILRMKYNGQKESPKHYFLKNLVADKLSRDARFSEIQVDKRFEGVCKDWRKPDVSALYKGKRIVFELQLSTTFLSVIAERNTFYEKNETYILWLFDNRRQSVESMRFMEKDIYFPNHHNAFFINERSADDKFSLICGYEKPILSNGGIQNIWETQEVDFSELLFDDNFRIYCFDYERELQSVKEKLKSIKLHEFEILYQSVQSDIEREKAFNELTQIFEIHFEDINYYELIALLNCLYSIKFKKVIGYNYKKLIQVLHQFIQKDIGAHAHFGEYALKAIGTYGAKDQVLQEDRTGKFVEKTRRYVMNGFELTHKYDQVLQLLFPELFEKKNEALTMGSSRPPTKRRFLTVSSPNKGRGNP